MNFPIKFKYVVCGKLAGLQTAIAYDNAYRRYDDDKKREYRCAPPGAPHSLTTTLRKTLAYEKHSTEFFEAVNNFFEKL
jgi:hypothetical protein